MDVVSLAFNIFNHEEKMMQPICGPSISLTSKCMSIKITITIDNMYTQDNVDTGYIYTMNILGIELSFPIFATSGIHVHSHLPRDVIHKNKEYEAYFTTRDICAACSHPSLHSQ